MSLLVAVHALLTAECGADATDDAIAEYIVETVRCSDSVDSWQDLNELLGGLSPQRWGALPATRRKALLQQLWSTELQHIAPNSHSTAPSRAPDQAGLPAGRQTALQESAQLNSIDAGRREPVGDEPDGNIDALAALCATGVSCDFLRHVLHELHGGDLQAAADWLVDDEDTAASVEEREAAWRDAETAADRERLEHENELRAVRQQLCCRYQLEAIAAAPPGTTANGNTPRMWMPADATDSQRVRYRDGVPVTTNGAKYITESLKEEWDGGSRGRVKTKGKRGAGFA